VVLGRLLLDGWVVQWRVRGMGTRATALVLAIVALAGAASLARAAELHTQPDARPRVEIAVHGELGAVEALRGQLEGATGDDVTLAIAGVDRIDLAAAVAPGPADAQTLARVWIELGAQGATHATIVVVDGARERALVRHVRAAEGIDAAVRETIATICASAIEGLRAGAVIGLERAAVAAELAPGTVPEPGPAAIAPPPPPPSRTASTAPGDPPRPPRRAPATGVPIELGWSLAAWSRAPAIQHGPMLGAGVVARNRLQPGGGITAQYRLPAIVDHPDVRTRLDSGVLRVWGGLHPEVASRLRLRARLGGGVDLLRADPLPRSTGVVPSPSSVRAIPIVRASFGLQIALPRRLAIAIDASVEADLVDTELVLRMPDRTVFDPWRARPGLAIALQWDPLAESAGRRAGP
jgi:hypothetical protein